MGFFCRGMYLLSFVLVLGCASTQGERSLRSPSPDGFTDPPQVFPITEVNSAQPVATESLKHVDAVNGFEIVRPSETWTLHSGDELSTEVILVPIVLLEEAQGAQVIVQIAPAIASPPEFAERLILGLETRGEFSTGEIREIDVADGAVGFDFTAAEQVIGRVAIIEGSNGKVFVLLATWPMSASESLSQEVDAILGSMKVL